MILGTVGWIHCSLIQYVYDGEHGLYRRIRKRNVFSPCVFFSPSLLWFCVHWSLSLLSNILMIPMGNVVPECSLWPAPLLINRHEYTEHQRWEDVCILTPPIESDLISVAVFGSPLLLCVCLSKGINESSWVCFYYDVFWKASKGRIDVRNKEEQLDTGPWRVGHKKCTHSSRNKCYIVFDPSII